MTGKFSDKTSEKLYDLDGGPDEEYGNTNEAPGRWWGLMLKTGIRGAQNAIITEDSQGFVEYETYKSAKDAQANFDRIVAETEADMEEADPDDAEDA